MLTIHVAITTFKLKVGGVKSSFGEEPDESLPFFYFQISQAIFWFKTIYLFCVKVLMELINAKIETLTMDSSEEDLKNIAEGKVNFQQPSC